MEGVQHHYRSTLDSIWPPVVQRWILCFPCDPIQRAKISEMLEFSFANVLYQQPYLAGNVEREIVEPTSGRYKVNYATAVGQKVDKRFWCKDLIDQEETWRYSYRDLCQEGMPISCLGSEILGPPIEQEKLGTIPVAAQANFIPGGCLLYICLNHCLFDGSGAAMIISAWAENCRNLQQHSHPFLATVATDDASHEVFGIPEVLQNSLNSKSKEIESILQKDSLWKLLGLRKDPRHQCAISSSLSTEHMIPAIFVASEESIAHLKQDCVTCDGDSQKVAAASSFEVTAALLWKCIMRARYLDVQKDERRITRLRIPVNLRKNLEISASYPGNVLLNSVTEMSLASLVSERQVSNITSEIHSSIQFTKDAGRAKEAIKLSSVLPEPSMRFPLFRTTTAEDLVLTSWQTLPFLEQDWGPIFGPTGRAEYFRIPNGNLPGICALFPRSKRGGVEVLISLRKAQLDRLVMDTEFMSYFKLQSG